MFTHPLEVMKTTRLNSGFKSHYELVAEILQDFTKVRARLQKKIKDISVWTKSETLKLLWMILRQGTW
jgi:hypothetical protein